jgi:copper(I)-binding protein
MTRSTLQTFAAACALVTGSAMAHITLPPGGVTAGSRYDAAFRVGHPCQGSTSTNAVAVQLPDGFTLQSVVPREGWANSTAGRTVTWKAERPEKALPQGERAEFIVRGQVTDKPGTLFFKVLQSCDKGTADWAQVPANADDKPAFGAARLEVLAPGVAPVEVRDAWVRTAVAGQSGTGAFMKITAPSGSRLVGITTPDAGLAEVHEMKMDGDVMRMRPLSSGLDLPARQTVELKPGGFHLMLTQLKQPLPVGATVPVSLQFVDAEGRKSSTQLQLPVLATAPGGAASMEHMPGMKH